MAYFDDLSHYTYFPRYPANYLNVGWLSATSPYSQGTVSDYFLSALEQLVKKPVHFCMGYHDCEFCQILEEIARLNRTPSYQSRLGNGEVHVPGENGKTYVAPVLVYHYVKEHQYKPPEEFISAVETWWKTEGQLNP